MNFKFFIFGITAFLIVDTYYDGKYTKMISVHKKYLKILMFASIGLSLYVFMKKHPNESRNMLTHASDLVKHLPIDRNTADLITPLFALSKPSLEPRMAPQMKRMLRSGGNSTKRSVSETKKKYVASQQNWKCAKCGQQLSASFETHHKIDLQFGGTNHVNNLEALCRNCHGEKTMMNHL